MEWKKNYVVLVDEKDAELGTMEKMKAHRLGILHRAFSVFIKNKEGKLILQQRADNKYHSGGLWSNTCCSHPYPQENILDAAHRRLQEEMGFDCPLQPLFTFRYKTEVGNGLMEHELDHLFAGVYDGKITINAEEVKEWKLIHVEELEIELHKNPDLYTPWLHLAFPEIKNVFVNFL